MQERSNRDLLYRSLDESLSEQDSEQLKTALATDVRLRQEREELLLLRHSLAQLRQQPSPSFTARVMQNLPVRMDVSTRIRRLWPAVAAACMLTFAVGLGTIFYTEGRLDETSLLGIDDDLLPEEVLVLGDY